MFQLYAEKNQLAVREKEPVTSGSVNVYTAQFEFSPDWEGMTRKAVFRAGQISRTVLLDENGTCLVPWEVLEIPGVTLMAGVFGRQGESSLPTDWARLGLILEGVPGCVQSARPPTPELWEQQLAGKGDTLAYDGLKLSLLSGEKELSSVEITGGGGGGGALPDIQAAAETLPAGSQATVTRTGSIANPVFTFGIPAGDQGFSPTVDVTEIAGGHRVTITDAEGPQSFDVMDGQDGTGGATAGVTSFNGRDGAVIPQTGDYTAEMVGAATMDQVNEAISAAITGAMEEAY